MQEQTATIKLPAHLAEQIQTYLQAGWGSDLNALIVEALRRYLESHTTELMEEFIRRDVEWGLHGND